VNASAQGAAGLFKAFPVEAQAPHPSLKKLPARDGVWMTCDTISAHIVPDRSKILCLSVCPAGDDIRFIRRRSCSRIPHEVAQFRDFLRAMICL